ncbi:MAG: addiction module protein [Desulfococcaceae bacterium]
METGGSLLTKALSLKPHERFLLIDELIRSLDHPDTAINEIWLEEASKRLKFHRVGKTKGISFKEVFGDNV